MDYYGRFFLVFMLLSMVCRPTNRQCEYNTIPQYVHILCVVTSIYSPIAFIRVGQHDQIV